VGVATVLVFCWGLKVDGPPTESQMSALITAVLVVLASVFSKESRILSQT